MHHALNDVTFRVVYPTWYTIGCTGKATGLLKTAGLPDSEFGSPVFFSELDEMERVTNWLGGFVLAALSLLPLAESFAEPANPVVTESIGVSVEVEETLELECECREGQGGPVVTSMDFGPMRRAARDGGEALEGESDFWVTCAISTSARPWHLDQTASPLMNEQGATIPSGAFLVIPQTTDAAGSPLPAGIQAHPAGSAVGDRRLFSSTTGTAAPVVSVYTLTSDPAKGATEPIPVSQASGTYTTVVTWTLTAD